MKCVIAFGYRITRLRYSSKETWYQHACCSFKILVWRLHYVFNILMGTCYVHAHIRQIVGCVYPQMLHSFLNKLFNDYYEYSLCMFRSILELIVLLKDCSCAVACNISFPIVWCAIVLLAIEYPLTSSRLACQLVKAGKKIYYLLILFVNVDSLILNSWSVGIDMHNQCLTGDKTMNPRKSKFYELSY